MEKLKWRFSSWPSWRQLSGSYSPLRLALNILREDKGNETVQFIGRAIQEGAMAFLSREYRLLAIFVVIVFVVLAALIDYDLLGRIEDTRRPDHTRHGHRIPGGRNRIGRLRAS